MATKRNQAAPPRRSTAPSRKPPAVIIAPHPDGGWQAKREQAERASKRTPTKKEATDAGRTIAINEGAELVIKGKDNKIQSRDSHGRDSPDRKG